MYRFINKIILFFLKRKLKKRVKEAEKLHKRFKGYTIFLGTSALTTFTRKDYNLTRDKTLSIFKRVSSLEENLNLDVRTPEPKLPYEI